MRMSTQSRIERITPRCEKGGNYLSWIHWKDKGEHICDIPGSPNRWPDHCEHHLHAHATLKNGPYASLFAVGAGLDNDQRDQALCLSRLATAVALSRVSVSNEEMLKWPEGLQEVVDLAAQRYDAKFSVEQVMTASDFRWSRPTSPRTST